MQKITGISLGAFLILITLSFLPAGNIFMNETASCYTLLFTGAVLIFRLVFRLFRKNPGGKFSVTTIDLAFFLFLSWIILNSFLIKKGAVDPFLWHKLGAVAGFYLLVRLTRQKELLIYSLILSGVIQAVIAAGQSRGLFSGYHLMFDVTGTLGNPGQLGGYLALCLTVTLCLLIVNIRKKRAAASSLLLFATVLQGAALYLSDSRAGWTGLFAGLTFFLITQKHKESNTRKSPQIPPFSLSRFRSFSLSRFRSFSLSRFRAFSLSCFRSFSLSRFRAFSLSRFRAFALSCFYAFVLSCFFILLYNYRPQSADARLLTWRVCCDMIAGRPLAGHGAGAFDEKYMLYQASFFEQHPESPFALVAGNAGYPFNELLNVLICFGATGLVLLLFLAWAVFWDRKHADNADFTDFRGKTACVNSLNPHSLQAGIFRAGLSSWIAFSMFSYPTEVFPLLLLGVACLGGINSGQHHPLRLRAFALKFMRLRSFVFNSKGVKARRRKGFLIILRGCFIVLMAVVLFRVWQDAAELRRLSRELTRPFLNMDDLESSYGRMKLNAAFNSCYMPWMENLPAELCMVRASELFPSPEAFCLKGRACLNTGETEQAIQAFYTASNMVPTLIRPKYFLWKLYVEKGDTAAAGKAARRILDSPVKAESIYTLKVKKEVKSYRLKPAVNQMPP